MIGERAKNKRSTLRERYQERARRIYEGADRLSGGALGLLVATSKSMQEAHVKEAAAGIAYYALFSLFPLLILIVILGTSFLDTAEDQEKMVNFIIEVLPPAKEFSQDTIQRVLEVGNELEITQPFQELIRANFQQILNLRVPVGIAAFISLFWSAASVFVILARNIDRAWIGSEGRNFLQWRLASVAMVGGLLIGLLALSMVVVFLFGLLDQIIGILLGDADRYQTPIESIFYRMYPDVVIFVTITILYWWAPKIKVKWSDAGTGALVAVGCLEVSKMAFKWYLESGLSEYQLIYGSLGTVIALMLWIYLSGLICLFGAHLTAQMVGRRQLESSQREETSDEIGEQGKSLI